MKKSYLFTFVTLLSISYTFASIIYVKQGSTGNGSSWGNAYGSLVTALQNAQSGDEIWVRQGVYTASETLDPNASFIFKNGLKVYGGFIGTETSLNQRVDISGTTTILSGALSATVKTKTILKIKNATSSLNLLDGFTIRDAYWVMTLAQNGGAGVQVISSKIAFKNVHISNNSMEMTEIMPYNSSDSLVGGAGMYSRLSDLTLRNVDIANNNFVLNHSTPLYTGPQGSAAGLCVLKGKINFKKGSIDNNVVSNTNYIVQGAGASFQKADSIYIESVKVSNNKLNNHGSGEGSGFFFNNNLKVKLVNNIFHFNSVNAAELQGVSFVFTTATVINNTFGSNDVNYSSSYNKALRIYYSNLQFYNCVFLENTSLSSSGNTVSYNNCMSKYPITFGTQNNVTIGVMDFINPMLGNYTPKACSPFLDTGNSSYNTSATDFGGNPRVVGSAIDIGAIELQNRWTNRVYVDASSTNTVMDGTSWATAYRDVYETLGCGCISNGITINPSEIWVAQGTYKIPELGYPWLSFYLNNNQKLYGGFQNGGVSLANRDITFATSQTILSGLKNGIPTYPVVRAQNTDNDTELNGFIVQDGYAVVQNGAIEATSGAGILVENGTMRLNNLWVRNNTSEQDGGGIYLRDAGINSYHLKVTGNTSLTGMGGGIGYDHDQSSQNYDTSLIPSRFSHLEISNNTANFAGGGICLQKGFPVVFEDFMVDNNTALSYGGGFYIGESPVSLVRGVIKSNSISGTGGGIYFDNNQNTHLESVIFSNNTAGTGAGLSTTSGNILANNITFVDNTASINGNAVTCSSALLSFKNSIISNPANGKSAISFYPSLTTISPNYTIENSLINEGILPGFTINNGVQFNTDPGFVDVANGNYHLLACSPAVDVGVNAFVTYSPTEDAATDPRIKNNIVDLGAYEYQYVDLAYVQQPNDITVTTGANGQFSVIAQNIDANYQWQVSQDGGATWNNLLGATSSELALNAVTTSMNGYLYRCIILHCGGTLSSTAGMLTVTGVMGVDQHLKNGLVLYPNPAKDFFIIRYDAGVSDGDIFVYDVQGREIYQENIKAGSLQQGAMVKISGWQDGLYWIKLHFDNEDTTIKFIKD